MVKANAVNTRRGYNSTAKHDIPVIDMAEKELKEELSKDVL